MFTPTGSQAGTIIAFPLSAAIIDAWGWEAVFYVQAVATMVWCVLWFLLVSDRPEGFRWISDAELEYILLAQGDSKHKKVNRNIKLFKHILTHRLNIYKPHEVISY